MRERLRWPSTLGEWHAFLRSTGLNERTATLALALGEYATQFRLPPVHLISGARPKGWGAANAARWDRGDRRGLAVRPAADSYHERAAAFDVDLSGFDAGQRATLGWIGEQLGLRWGGRFKTPDPAHFDTGA